MTSCSAWMASVAMAETRAGSTDVPPRVFCAKRSVALRPEPAAVGLASVAVMVSSCVGAVGVWCERDGAPRRPVQRLAADPPGTRPEPATGGAGRGPSTVRGRGPSSPSGVPAVVGELVGVDLDAEPRSGTDGELPAGDLQQL